MNVRWLVLGCVLGIGGYSAKAQPPGMPAAGSIASPAQAFDSQLSNIEQEMMSAVKAMPADKFGFAPSATTFAPGLTTEFNGVRSAAHVAEANYFFYSIVSGMKPDVDTSKIEKLTNKDDIVAALAGSFTFAHKAIATLNAANAFEVIKSPEPGFQTRATLAAFGIAHAFDHYGQMAVYLRMNGIVPPASAK